MTDNEMTKVAEMLRRQLRLATPETYTFRREIVFDLAADFCLWFSDTDPDFLGTRFMDLIFEDYPAELYG